MSNAKEIRSQIKSVKSTQKITKAMEMVAASKVRRVQNYMRGGRPYAEHIQRVIAHLVRASSSTLHPFLVKPEKVETVGYIVISTDRGLCGGLNINLFKTLWQHICGEQKKGHKIVATVFGRKGVAFLNRAQVPLLSTIENYPEEPQTHELIGAIYPMIEGFNRGEIQKIYIVGNVFENAMTQKPTIAQLLPASVQFADGMTAKHAWDYIYEPNAESILDTLLKRYLEFTVKQAVAENIACEMSARMLAMKSASDNAGALIKELQLKYNKARQTAITQELTEIVAGADAV